MTDSTHVFLRQDALRRPLDSTYSGSYKVLALTKETLRIAINGRPVTVSTNRAKPAYTMLEPEDRIVTARATRSKYRNPYHSRAHQSTSRAEYPFRPPTPLPGAVQLVSIIREGSMWELHTILISAPFSVITNNYTGQSGPLFRAKLKNHTGLYEAFFRAQRDISVYYRQSQFSLLRPITGQCIPTNQRPVYYDQSQTTHQPIGPNKKDRVDL